MLVLKLDSLMPDEVVDLYVGDECIGTVSCEGVRCNHFARIGFDFPDTVKIIHRRRHTDDQACPPEPEPKREVA